MNKKLIGGLGIASVALVGGTFAYFTQVATIDNPFDTAKYQSVVTEDFVPEDGENWQPGVKVNKDLYVQNTGDRDVVVRVKFEDFWYRGDALVTKAQDAANANTFVELFGEVVTKQLADGETTFQYNETDGETEKDGTVVFKTFENSDKWTFNPEDGYFYYNTRLEAGTSTDKFLDEVQLDPKLDLGLFNTEIYSKVDTKGQNPQVDIPENTDIDQFMVEKGWIWIEEKEGKEVSVTPTNIELFNMRAETNHTKESLLENNQSIYTTAVTRAEKDKAGYGDANYILRITVETVQATDKAVAQVFSTADEKVVEGWKLDKEDLAEETTGAPVTP